MGLNPVQLNQKAKKSMAHRPTLTQTHAKPGTKCGKSEGLGAEIDEQQLQKLRQIEEEEGAAR